MSARFDRVSAALALSLALAQVAAGQSSGPNLIEDEMEGLRSSFLHLGPFYVTPSLRLGTGYDSNPLSTPTAESDITALVGPAVRLAAPLGGAVFFEVVEELDFVYYREQVDLRRVWNVTNASVGFGGRRFLVGLRGGLRTDTGRPSSEFDFPVEQKTANLDATLGLALGWRHRLDFDYTRSRYEITQELNDPTVSTRLNRNEDRGTLTLSRRLTAKTVALAEAFADQYSFEDNSRDGNSYGVRFGFEFSPTGGDPLTSAVPLAGSFVNGRLLLGFRSVAPFDPERVDYQGIVGSVDVTFGFGEGQRLQALYGRDIVPSIFDQNWYYVENRWGASFTYQVTERFSVTPGFSIGQNRYPLPAETDEGAEEIFDDHRSFRLAFDFRITETWTVGVASDYLDRESNVSAFTKDRLQVGFTMSFRP